MWAGSTRPASWRALTRPRRRVAGSSAGVDLMTRHQLPETPPLFPVARVDRWLAPATRFLASKPRAASSCSPARCWP